MSLPAPTANTWPPLLRLFGTSISTWSLRMAVQVTCPGCSTTYSLAEELRGKNVRCKQCSQVFRVETPRAGEPPVALPEAEPAKEKPARARDALQERPGRVPAQRRAAEADEPDDPEPDIRSVKRRRPRDDD